MLDRLTRHTHVDFDKSNAYGLLIWIIKHANVCFDDQIVRLVERMTGDANISLYSSNMKTFGKECWRYGSSPKDLDRYSLEYRVVLHRIGGINTSDSNWEREQFNGLSENAFHFINDILTVANNLRFDTSDSSRAGSFAWEANKQNVFYYRDHKTGKPVELMKVRAFLNGNLHIKFNQGFICALNVEFGRLKGWLKHAQDAVDEMGVTLEEAESHFASNLVLDDQSFLSIGFSREYGEQTH